MKRINSLIGAGLLVLLAVASSHAAVIFATNPTGVEWAQSGNPVTLGTSFTVGASPISITSLGYFDQTGAGLNFNHQVGIYSLSQALLGSVNVASGTETTYHDGTRWMTLGVPINLDPNTQYLLAFTMTSVGDPSNVAAPGAVTINPAFALSGNGYTYAWGGTLAFPATEAVDGLYAFGGNMMADVPEPSPMMEVPEPSQAVAIGIMLLTFTGYRFHRSRRPQAA